MDAQRKQAYRWLLYLATLEIRPLQWIGRRGWRRLNPFCWWSQSQQVRRAGAIADWLHNLAIYSAIDFDRFDEERFWKDYQWFLDNHPNAGLDMYRSEFERRAKTPENVTGNEAAITNSSLN